jgi:hypothetical protein
MADSEVGQLAADIVTLIRDELDLAKREMTAKAKSAGVGAGILTASAVTGVLALGSLTAVLAVVLSLAMPLWLALLLVTGFWAVVTAALVLFGKRNVEAAAPFLPEQTIANVKEDIAWARRDAK